LVPDKRVVSVRFVPRVSEEQIEAYVRSLRENPLFDRGFSGVVDLRQGEDISLSGEQVVELADCMDPYSLDSKRAFVVRNAVQGHAVRMHQILRCAKSRISIFFSREEARVWIGV